jgi:DNA-binding PadR family transcriptional regulator
VYLLKITVVMTVCFSNRIRLKSPVAVDEELKAVPFQDGIMHHLFNDYAFVVAGKKRSEVLKLLAYPRTPTEMAKMLQVHANVITRILKDLKGRQLVECHELQGRNKTFHLTKRGEFARQVLDNLIEPKTLKDLVRLMKVHRTIIYSALKHLVQSGFVAIFRTIRPARKFYQLTKKGEEVREKMEIKL